jgi:hypothetical protein
VVKVETIVRTLAKRLQMDKKPEEYVGTFLSNYGKIYKVDNHHPDYGFWCINVDDPTDRKSVAERSIGRTYFEAKAPFSWSEAIRLLVEMHTETSALKDKLTILLREHS